MPETFVNISNAFNSCSVITNSYYSDTHFTYG